jgi:hypothetical protein
MLTPGTILPPVPIRWQGHVVRSDALRGQPALFLFPCAVGCASCEAFFQAMQASKELAYWSIRPLLVLPQGAQESATDAAIVDEEGRCRALASPGEGPAAAVFDAYQEFRGTWPFDAHAFPSLDELEALVHSALRADPG